jgi:hypothetical protein
MVRAPWRSSVSRSCPEDRLDALADRREVGAVVGLVLARGAHQFGVHALDRELELAAGVALVGDERLAAAQGDRQELERNLTLGPVGRDQRGGSGRAVGRRAEVQTHPPEEARMRLAVAIAAEVGQLGAAGSLDRSAALHRGRVEQHHLVVSAGAVGGEDSDEPLDRVPEAAPALVEARLLGQLGEQPTQALGGHGQEAPIGRDTHDRLGHAERDDLRVCDPAAGVSWPLRQEIVRRAVNGSEEQVEVGVHRGLPVSGVVNTADFGLSSKNPSNTASAVESTI